MSLAKISLSQMSLAQKCSGQNVFVPTVKQFFAHTLECLLGCTANKKLKPYFLSRLGSSNYEIPQRLIQSSLGCYFLITLPFLLPNLVTKSFYDFMRWNFSRLVICSRLKNKTDNSGVFSFYNDIKGSQNYFFPNKILQLKL